MRLGVSLILAGIGLSLVRPLAAFEGSIKYRITDKRGEVHALTMTLAGGKMRTEMEMEGRTSISIIDQAAHTVTTLMPGSKTYMSFTFDPAKSMRGADKGTLSKTGNTDTVAGYPVQEWVYQTAKSKVSLWVTDKLGAGFMQTGKASSSIEIPTQLRSKGLALRIVGDNGFKMEAVKVEPGVPDASLFEVPDGYSKMGGDMGGQEGTPVGAGMPPDAQAKIQAAMQNMTPDQKAMLEKMMQNQGAAAQ
jgi:hypothetical protein